MAEQGSADAFPGSAEDTARLVSGCRSEARLAWRWPVPLGYGTSGQNGESADGSLDRQALQWPARRKRFLPPGVHELLERIQPGHASHRNGW